MRLDYRILWFEDNDESREHFEDDLRQHLEKRGYELSIEWLKKYPLAAPRHFENYDLIVTDLHLLGSGDGAALVTEIRKKRILTEVILYSGYPQEFEAAIAKLGGLDRVSYHNGRNEKLQAKIRDIVDSTIRKVEGVRNMRGLVIAEAIELEGKLRRILVELMTLKADSAARAHLEVSIRDHLAAKIRFLQKKAAEVAAAAISHEIVQDEQMMSAHDCHVLACKVLSAVSGGKGAGHAHFGRLTPFNKEVIDLRNTLAHVAEELDEVGQTILRSRKKGGGELVLDATKCAQIRKSLRDYRALFSDVAPFLGVKPS